MINIIIKRMKFLVVLALLSLIVELSLGDFNNSTKRRRMSSSKRIKQQLDGELVFGYGDVRAQYASTRERQSFIALNDATELQEKLQEILNNLAMIDYYTKENVQQFKMLNECNEKLNSIQAELSNPNNWQQSMSVDETSEPNSNRNNFNKIAPFTTINMLTNIREHLKNFFK